ncbi:transporter [Pseudonocardiaceae bacterium YIM PH 21723]|nr:transporter [Pseudonocardiaceae bacterium YIM PH 21723]
MNLGQVFGAVVPALLILLVGYYAGRRGYFTGEARTALNTLTLRFALPAALFTGVAATPTKVLLSEGPLLVLLVIAVLGMFGLALLAHRLLAGRWVVVSALAMCWSMFAFMGIPILGALSGSGAAAVPIGMEGIVVNVVLAPLGLTLLAGRQAGGVLGALREPIAWAPLLGLACALLSVPLPGMITGALHLLGAAASAVALIAVGVTVASMGVPRLTGGAIAITVVRLLVIPLLVFGIGVLLFGHDLAAQAALVVAFPVSPVVMMLAAKHAPEQEQTVASAVVFSVIGSALTLPLLIALIGH